MWCLQHLHEEGVDGRIADELEEEKVLQTLETNGAQCRQTQEQFSEPETRTQKQV